MLGKFAVCKLTSLRVKVCQNFWPSYGSKFKLQTRWGSTRIWAYYITALLLIMTCEEIARLEHAGLFVQQIGIQIGIHFLSDKLFEEHLTFGQWLGSHFTGEKTSRWFFAKAISDLAAKFSAGSSNLEPLKGFCE